MKSAGSSTGNESTHGVALILVMLALFVLSVLAASIVFSARSETFASYNYRVLTQADYVAKAGLQRAVNFFNSDKYVPVPPGGAPGTYNMSQYAFTPVALYNAKQRPVRCTTGVSGCGTAAVVLSVDSGGSFNGNYPTQVAGTPLRNPDGDTIPTAFRKRFYNVALDPLSSSSNSGQFTVKATLEGYFTVNDAFYPAIDYKPYEVWHVTSTGTWNSNVGAGFNKPTSIQEATLAPIYLPYFANALYGMCNIKLNGTVCTDSYNSRNGNYNCVGSGCAANCVTGSTAQSNAIASGAGVGAGGNVDLVGSSYVVNGDVSYGASAPSYSAPWTCPAATSGVSGSVVGVRGAVQPVPAIPEPPQITFPDCLQYGGTTSCPGIPPDTPNNYNYVWIKNVTGIGWAYQQQTSSTVNYALTGSGTTTDPFRLPGLSVGTDQAVCLAGGDDAGSPIYYDIKDIDQGNGRIFIVRGSNPPASCPPPAGYNSYGYAVLNIYKTFSTGAQGITQFGAPPASLVINVNNSGCNAPCPANPSGTSVKLSGQGNVSAVITALGDATLGGGGGGATPGAFYGSIIAGSVTDGGTYAVHYDQSLQVLSGKLMPIAIQNFSRPKY